MQDKVLDLDKYHFRHVRGDIVAIGTWLRVESDRWRPCLVLIRLSDEISGNKGPAIPCVITMDNCWIFDDRVGDPYRAALMAIQFAENLRLDFVNKRDIIRVLTIINDYMSDIISMPPRPYYGSTVIGEGEMIDTTTGRSREIILTESG